mmetsp:Transcript_8340/g.19717  ORF Transcript_8340/g.19717 Transcript_8340/m.19717 type:complete len:286 (+) Transcript_8340:1153-2010(+)
MHGPELVEALIVAQLKVPELGLQVLVLLCDAPVLLRQLVVLLPVARVGLVIPLHEGAQRVLQLVLLALERAQRVRVLIVALRQHAVIVLELLSVELVCGLHLLQLLLERLDVGLELNLQLVVLLVVMHNQVLDLLLVRLFPLLLGLHVRQLTLPPPVEQRIDLALVRREQLLALGHERALNVLELDLVLLLQLLELTPHPAEKLLDILALLLQALDVLLIFSLELDVERADQVVLRVNDLFAAPLLALDLVVELLRHVLLQQLSPAHLHRGVLLSRAHRLLLQTS